MLDVGHEPLLLGDKFCVFEVPPNCGLPHVKEECISASPTCLYVPLLAYVVDLLFI